MAASRAAPSPSPAVPVIPAGILHPTDQRLLFLSLFVLLQASKLAAFILPLDSALSPSTTPASVSTWAAFDAAFVLCVGALRVPRLSWTRAGRLAIIAGLVGGDWLCLGGGWRSIPFSALLPSTLSSALTFYPTLSSSHVRLSDILRPQKHLSGAFELVVTPFSTARLLPPSTTLPCLSSSSKSVSLPLHFSTLPGIIEYSITLPAELGGATELFNISASALEQVKRRAVEGLTEGDDDEDDEDEDEVEGLLSVGYRGTRKAIKAAGEAVEEAIKTGVTLLLPVNKASTVRLSRVFPPTTGNQASHHSFRIPLAGNVGVKVHKCPSVSIIPSLPSPSSSSTAARVSGASGSDYGVGGSAGERCVGSKGTLDLVVRGEGGVRVGWLSKDAAGRKESGFLEGIGLENAASLDTDATGGEKSFLVPLPLTFDTPGKKTYSLTSIASPNTPLRSLSQKVEYTVLPNPSVSFKPGECSITNPRVLLNPEYAPKNYKPQGLTILAADKPLKGYEYLSTVTFTPSARGAEVVTKELTIDAASTTLDISTDVREGVWRIEDVGVKGGLCGGDVKEPRECKTVFAPIPKFSLEVSKLEDDCAGEQGTVASLSFLGQAPYRLSYSLTLTPFATPQRPHPTPHTTQFETSSIRNSQHDLTLKPETEGEYVYTFISMSDARYNSVPVGGRVEGSVKQVVQADFRLKGNKGLKTKIWECQEKTIDLEVTVTGKTPYELSFLIASPSASSTSTHSFSTAGHHSITLPVPDEYLLNGGTYGISLLTVKDGNGCVKKLHKKVIEVEVVVGRPEARIASSRTQVVKEGEQVKIPLRLKGEKPWTVTYSNSAVAKDIVVRDLQNANTDLVVDNAALYKLVSVKDAHCQGSIVKGQDTFEVQHLAKPTVELQVEGDGSKHRKNWKTKGVCVGKDDHVSLHFEGQAPFNASYSVTKHRGLVHRDAVVGSSSVGSIASSTVFPLHTSEPGVYTYTFNHVGDANYPSLYLPSARRITFDHEVYGRPSAMFVSTKRISLCSNSRLGPSTLPPGQGLLLFKGKAPFEVTLHIQTAKATHPVVRTISNIQSNEWQLSIDDYEFHHLGVYSISIETVRDASGCEQDLSAEEVEEAKTLKVEVAETASVAQLQRGEDVCVGQALDFQLQGSPPWSLTWKWDGKEFSDKTSNAKFSRLADRPGTFAITSIAHQRNQCKTKINDIVRKVHALPSARIKAGDHFIETVEEGEQAEIIFEFNGEAPFSFTYTRSTSGRSPTVLESHTVSGIQDHSYSIFASTEGVWKVTEIEDRWCRFPPLASSSAPAKPASMLEGIDIFPPIAPP